MIDFEGSLASGILEYGVVTLLDGKIQGARTRLCRATGRIRKEDTEVHGLDVVSLEGARPFREDFELFATLRGQGPFAAHFAQAENSLIKGAWPFCREVPLFAKEGVTTCEWGPWVDSARVYREVFGDAAQGGLGEMVGRFGLQAALDACAADHCPRERRHYHAALYDALAASLLLVKLGERPEFREMSLAWLLQASASSAEKRSGLQQEGWDF